MNDAPRLPQSNTSMAATPPACFLNLPNRMTRDEDLRMTKQSEIERDKAVVHAFYQAGIDGDLTSFARYLDPNFTWTAPNYLPWGGTHTGATLFRDQVLSSLPDVFDFAVRLHQRYRRRRPRRRGHPPGCYGHRRGHPDRRLLDRPERQGHVHLGCLFRTSGTA
jgi:hypothetical protein